MEPDEIISEIDNIVELGVASSFFTYVKNEDVTPNNFVQYIKSLKTESRATIYGIHLGFPNEEN